MLFMDKTVLIMRGLGVVMHRDLCMYLNEAP